MGYAAREFIEEASKLGIKVCELESNKAKSLRELVCDRFFKKGLPKIEYDLIEADFKSVGGGQVWTWIKEYPSHDRVFLFFENSRDKSILQLEKLSDYVSVAAECHGYTSYLVDCSGSFMLVDNCDGFLLGLGEAKSWLDIKIDEKGRRGTESLCDDQLIAEALKNLNGPQD